MEETQQAFGPFQDPVDQERAVDGCLIKSQLTLPLISSKITIGNGKKATFSIDRWLFDQIPPDIAPGIFKISIRKNMTVKEALSNEKWLFDQRHHLDVHHLPQLLKLAELVERVCELDDIVWRFGNKTFYTVPSAYMLQFLGQLEQTTPR
jgi:hypothetical protein